MAASFHILLPYYTPLFVTHVGISCVVQITAPEPIFYLFSPSLKFYTHFKSINNSFQPFICNRIVKLRKEIVGKELCYYYH